MRILFISNLYPPYDLGGMEQICQEVVEAMKARGHVCHVLTSRYGVCGHSPSEEGVTRALHLQANVNYYRPLDFFTRRPWNEEANRRALRYRIDRFEPDIAFIWGMWNLSRSIAYWAEQWLPDKIAYNIQDYWPLEADIHERYWSSPGKSRAAQLALRPFSALALGTLAAQRCRQPRLCHVSCCSRYVADLLTTAGVLRSGAVAILNGIDPTPFVANASQGRGQDGALKLLYFGGLMEHKGVHTAIQALGLLQQRGQACGLRLTLVGAGHPDYEAHLHDLVGSLSVEDKVHFAGRVPRTEIPTILPNFDIFLFTSIYPEPFGRTIIEAMASGLAVIGADVGGSREVFKFYPEDMMFEPGNSEELAVQIQRLANNPDLLQRLRQAGPDLVHERFTLDRMVEEIDAWLQAVRR